MNTKSLIKAIAFVICFQQTTKAQTLRTKIDKATTNITEQFASMSKDRTAILDQVAFSIFKSFKENQTLDIIFIDNENNTNQQSIHNTKLKLKTMKLSQVKLKLNQLDKIAFQLPHGQLVPNHFHVTEVGKVTRHFIDCGGTVRKEEVANFQLWNANDYDHRLHPEKLFNIIKLSQKILDIEDLEIEVEYQGQTIEKFGLDFDGSNFLLTTKQTDCLAKDQCGIQTEKPKLKLSQLEKTTDCNPHSGCC